MSLKKSLEKLKAAMRNSMNVNDQPLLQMQPLNPEPTTGPGGVIECPKIECYSTLKTNNGDICMRYSTYYQYMPRQGCVRSNMGSYKVFNASCESMSMTPVC